MIAGPIILHIAASPSCYHTFPFMLKPLGVFDSYCTVWHSDDFSLTSCHRERIASTCETDSPASLAEPGCATDQTDKKDQSGPTTQWLVHQRKRETTDLTPSQISHARSPRAVVNACRADPFCTSASPALGDSQLPLPKRVLGLCSLRMRDQVLRSDDHLGTVCTLAC